MKTLKAFIKPFKAPKRKVKIKTYVGFNIRQLSEMYGAGKFTNDLCKRNVLLSLKQ